MPLASLPVKPRTTGVQMRKLAPPVAAPRADDAPWETLDPDAVLLRLDARRNGIGGEEARARLARVGPNTLPRREAPPFWRLFVLQFKSPLIYILGVAAVVSAAIGEVSDAGFIALVLVINALIGGWQEWKSEQGAQALQKLLRVRASVERDGEVREVDAEELVPGDVVWLESGGRVPADLRLLATQGLEIDESLLTGESLPVGKDAAWLAPGAAPVGDRRNMAHAGSLVIRGRASAVVVATGRATEVGRLASDVLDRDGARPPLLVRMDRFVHGVGVAILGAILLLGVVGVWQGYSAREMFFGGIALAVSAIPEGLPIALTVALAIGARRMARRRVIVRKLAAVEGLGSCSLIASDKTGTLTCNEITVRTIVLPDGTAIEVGGQGFVPEGRLEAAAADHATPVRALARAAVLCNEGTLHREGAGWTWRGDPTDVALLAFGHKEGSVREEVLATAPIAAQIPFEPERRFAASYHRVAGDVRVYAKGAPERVLAMCEGVDRAAQLDRAEALARGGFRVLALAEGAVDGFDPAALPPEPAGLRFLGFVGMIDPLRPGVQEAVQRCAAAGVRVCMVTGDHPATALAIAKDLGIAASPDEVVTGAQVEAADDEALRALVEKSRVFARTAPAHKLRIVEAAQALGHFVAVTGDGVNDGPALRAANIGIAMGKDGTDVAREASDLVISDDNFTSIVSGIEEGRVSYANVRKVIFLLISTGAAEIVLILLAIATKSPIPLLPAQLLWLNLVTNGIQDKALGMEPSEGDELRRPPARKNAAIFDRLMIERTLLAAVVMGGVGFAAFRWMLDAGWSEAAARNGLLLLMVLFENFHIGNCRSETRSAFSLSPLRNPSLLVAALLAQLVHLGAMSFPPLQKVLGVEPVSLEVWLVMFALAASVLVASELHKVVLRARYAR